MLLLLSGDFFLKIILLFSFFQEHHQSVKQFGSRPVWTFCRSATIWVQTVCNSYQQTTKVTASEDRAKDKYQGVHVKTVNHLKQKCHHDPKKVQLHPYFCCSSGTKRAGPHCHVKMTNFSDLSINL